MSGIVPAVEAPSRASARGASSETGSSPEGYATAGPFRKGPGVAMPCADGKSVYLYNL